jgi:hypothetical protein
MQKEGSVDLAIIQPLQNLKELVIRGADTIVNLEKINEHPGLEVLSLAGDKLSFDLSLIRLPRLRWITIPSRISQEAFNKLVDTHPDLEVVEIFRNDTIRDLRPLGKLTKLCGLAVMDTITDIPSVKMLKNLKYLSLPKNQVDDSTKTAEWKHALPGTVIVANEGFCLGSGWLLLLIPLVFFITILIRSKK